MFHPFKKKSYHKRKCLNKLIYRLSFYHLNECTVQQLLSQKEVRNKKILLFPPFFLCAGVRLVHAHNQK